MKKIILLTIATCFSFSALALDSKCGYVMHTPTVSPYVSGNTAPTQSFNFSVTSKKSDSKKGDVRKVEAQYTVNGANTAAMMMVYHALENDKQLCVTGERGMANEISLKK